MMENKINVKLLSMAGQGGSAFGIALMELMKGREDIIVLSADMSTPAGLDKFKAAYPNHFMNVGIAEQNMIGIAAGLADEGYKVICVAQACFITMRSFEQVRQYCGYMRIPIVIVGIGSGLSLQYMGATHYAVEDVTLMRTISDMTVICPCDALEAMKALKFAVDNNTSVYIRLFGGTGIPPVYQEDYSFSIGKGIKKRDGKDILIIANGTMVHQSLKVAKVLSEQEGIEATVINMHTVKPLDTQTISENIKGKKLIVTIEEGQLNGGLGSAVAEYVSGLADAPRLLRSGIQDIFPHPGSYNYLLEQCELSVEQIKRLIYQNCVRVNNIE